MFRQYLGSITQGSLSSRIIPVPLIQPKLQVIRKAPFCRSQRSLGSSCCGTDQDIHAIADVLMPSFRHMLRAVGSNQVSASLMTDALIIALMESVMTERSVAVGNRTKHRYSGCAVKVHIMASAGQHSCPVVLQA